MRRYLTITTSLCTGIIYYTPHLPDNGGYRQSSNLVQGVMNYTRTWHQYIERFLPVAFGVLFAEVTRMGFSAMTHSLYATETATRLLDACLYRIVFFALVDI